MSGSKTIVKDLINSWKIKHNGSPAYIIKKLQDLFNVLEDVYSVGTTTEIQEAIDTIGTGSGTIFIESGTYTIDTTIDIDNCGSIVIYGHGNNTVLQPTAGTTVFNITCASSLLIKTLRIDASNYIAAGTQAIIVNETNDNICSFQDLYIDGNDFGIGIELQSNNCVIDKCTFYNLDTGVYVNASENHIIDNNIFLSNAQYGIYLNLSDSNTISSNSCTDNGTHGIYIHDSDYLIISQNGCISNDHSGIYSDTGGYNTINGNKCNNNSYHGVYLTASDYTTISANTCKGNDSNIAGDTAGIYIHNSSYCAITSNSSNDNNNAGAGDAYGIIIIGGASSLENVVASNNANGNDIDYKDSGQDTTITYYVQDYQELQDAIDSIGTKAGTIILDNSFTVNTAIDIDGNGSYIIKGEGSNSTLTLGADIKCFNITSARFVYLENFKIDASGLTTNAKEVIDITEGSNNLISINNVEITGDGSHGHGIELNSNNCEITNCNIDNMYIGINILSTDNLIQSNTITSCSTKGIQLGADSNTLLANISNSNQRGIYLSADYNLLNGNYIESNTINGIELNGSNYNSIQNNYCTGNDSNTANPQAGIYIDADSDYNKITNNSFIDNNNAGAGEGYGVYIANVNCNENIIKDNAYSGNDKRWYDGGTNTQMIYYVFSQADIEDAVTSIGTGSGTIILPQQTITLASSIALSGGGRYIIEGEGEGSVINCGDVGAFIIENAKRGTTLKNFKIYGEETGNTEFVYVRNEELVFLDDLVIENDSINGIGVYAMYYGVGSLEANIKVTNCYFTNLNYGLQINGYDAIVSHCTFNTGTRAITLDTYAITCNISFNYIDSFSDAGIRNNGDYNIIAYNIIRNCDAFGTVGLDITGDYTRVIGMIYDSNTIDYDDTGAGTILFGDDTAYAAAWNGDLGTPTKNAVYDILNTTISDLDGFPDELKNLVTAEIQQLENIGAVTISNVQWGYLGAMTGQPLESLAGSSIADLGTKDHDLLDGLGDDDHTQYLLVNGTRAMTGDLDLAAHNLNGVASIDAGAAGEITINDELIIKSTTVSQIQIWDRNGDLNSNGIIFYEKNAREGLSMQWQKDGAYATRPLYLFDGSNYQPALYDNFPYAITLGASLTLGGDLGLNGHNIDFPTTANISDCLDDDTFATASATTLATSESIKAYVDSQVGAVNSLAEILALGNEANGNNILLDEGADLIVYSDNKITEVARIDGASGNITTSGTIDGVDIAAHDGGAVETYHDLTTVTYADFTNLSKYTDAEAVAAVAAADDYLKNDANDVTTGRLTINYNNDVTLAGVTGSLIIGGTGSGQHIAIDGNEIQSKSNGTTAAAIYLQNLGGQTNIGGNVNITGNITLSGTVDGVDIAAHDGGAVKTYHDVSAIAWADVNMATSDVNMDDITPANTNLDMNTHSITNIDNLRFDDADGQILIFYSDVAAELRIWCKGDSISYSAFTLELYDGSSYQTVLTEADAIDFSGGYIVGVWG